MEQKISIVKATRENMQEPDNGLFQDPSIHKEYTQFYSKKQAAQQSQGRKQVS